MEDLLGFSWGVEKSITFVLHSFLIIILKVHIMGVIVFFVIIILVMIIVLTIEQKESAKKRAAEREKEIQEAKEREMRAKMDAEEESRRLKQLYDSNPAEYFQTLLGTELETKFDYKILDGASTYFPEVSSIFEDGMLGLEYKMPTKDDVSRVKETYFLKNGEARQKIWSERDFPKIYEDHLYHLCLSAIDLVFSNDPENKVSSVVFNGYVIDYSPTTGQLEKRIIMSLLVSREQFVDIDVEHVDAKQCFKYLKGVSAAKLIDVTPITPVLSFDKNDNRFIENKSVETESGTNLASMDWEDFEHLVRLLFEREFSSNGSDVKVTRASRDGGVDAVVFDPDPLRGGKIVIQAKRYTNTVGVSAVRDLYGTVINEGANSGILITTSDYGHDSYEFAKDKPLKLLNSGHLLALLHKNGIKGYINIAEAKNVSRFDDNGKMVCK